MATNYDVKRLAKELNELKQRMRGMQAPQLIHSSIENGYIYEYDGDGNEVGRIGKQHDGGHGYVPFTGPTPPVPSAPLVEPSPGMFTVAWDGIFVDPDTGLPDPLIYAPSDFAQVEVHVGLTADFLPEIQPNSATRSGAFSSAGGGQLTHVPLEGSGTFYVAMVASSTPGKFSAPSVVVEVTIEPFVDLSELEADLEQLALDLDAASQEIADTGAALDARLIQAAIDLDAAEQAITDLETVTLPALQTQLNEASDWIDATGVELGTRLGTAESDLNAAESRLNTAEGKINTAFPNGAFNVDAAIDQTIKSSIVQYAVNSSETTAPTSGWSANTPTRTPGSFIWFRTLVTYGNDSTSTSSAALLTGNTGSTGATGLPGATGSTGAAGVSVTEVKPYFLQKVGAAPAQPTALSPAGWSTTEPSWVTGESLYRADRVLYSNGTHSWTPVTKVASYEGINAAMLAANGKNAVTYTDVTAANKPGPAPTVASGSGRTQWDIHRNRNASTGEIYAEYRWTGSAWQAVNYGDEILRSLDVGKLSAGTATINTLVAQKIAGETAQFINLDVKNLVSTNATINSAVVNQLWTDVVRSKKITSDMVLIGKGENLLPWMVDSAQDIAPHSFASTVTTSQLYTSASHGGTYHWYVVNESTPGIWRDTAYFKSDDTHYIPVNPDTDYRAEVWIRNGGNYTNGNPNVRLTAYSYDEGKTLLPATVTGTPVLQSWDWQLVELNFKTPLTGSFIALRLQQNQPGGIRFDDLSLRLRDGASLIVDGTIAAKHVNAESIGAAVGTFVKLNVKDLVSTNATIDEGVVNQLWTDVIRSKKITTDMLLVGSGINLVVDPGFANTALNSIRISASTGSWAVLAADPAQGPARVRSNASTGQQAFRLTAPETEYVPVEPGSVYRIKYQGRRGSGVASTRPAVAFRRLDGTVSYAAVDQSAYVSLTTVWKWYEFTWTVPEDVVEARWDIQTGGGSTTWTNYAYPSVTVSGASLIVNGTIGADKIIANEIGAAVGDFVEVKAENIKAGQINAALIVGSGKIATATSGARVELAGNGITAYENYGFEMVEIKDGTFRSWAGIYPNRYKAMEADGEGVRMKTSTQSGITIRTDGDNTFSSGVIEFSGSTGAVAGKIALGQIGSVPRLNISTVGSGSSISINAVGPVNIGGSSLSVNTDSVSMSGVYSSTFASTANVYVSSTGRFYRATSLTDTKIAIEQVGNEWEAVKQLSPVTYYDRGQAEALAEAIESGDEGLLDQVEYQTKQIGLLAEQVEDTGMTGLATYDSQGALNGVAYERVGVALIPWLKDLESEVASLREEVAVLRGGQSTTE